VDAFEALEAETLGSSFGDVENEVWTIPPLVLLAVDVESGAADLAEQQVVTSREKLADWEADRGAAVAAAPRLEQHELPVRSRQLTDRSERCIGCDDPVGHVHHA
jgi:hypothetical protein